MAKKYLNAQEKSIALTIASISTYLDDRIEEWIRVGRPKDQVKYAKMARSFLNKVLEFMVKDLDHDENTKIIKELRKMQVVVKYSDQAVKEYLDMQKLDSVTPVETEDLLEIVSLALASCDVCEDPGEHCSFKKIFIKYDMAPPNLEPEPGGCPYRRAK